MVNSKNMLDYIIDYVYCIDYVNYINNIAQYVQVFNLVTPDLAVAKKKEKAAQDRSKPTKGKTDLINYKIL